MEVTVVVNFSVNSQLQSMWEEGGRKNALV